MRDRMVPLSLLVIVLYASSLQWFFGWRTILSQWQSVGSGTGFLALALLVGTYFIRAHRMQDYFPEETSGRFLVLFRVTQIHNLLNIMLPLRTGETSFPLLMRSEFGITLARGASALFVLRLLDLHALLAAGGIGLVAASAHPIVAGVLWLGFLVLPLALFPLRRTVMSFAGCLLPQKLVHIIHQIEAGIPKDLHAFVRAWSLTAFNWGIKIIVLAWMLGLMGVAPLAAAFGGALGGEISSVLPVHAPAGVGTYPAGITAGAIALGAPQSGSALSVLATASVNLHLLIIVSTLVGTTLSLLLPLVAARGLGRA